MAALIGVLLAVLAGLMAAPSIVRSQLAATQTLREITTAQEQVILNDAAATYMQANSASLLAAATPSAPVVVSVPTLIAANVLRPATFSATNPYGQTWQVEVTQPTAGTLQALVLGVGGTALSDIQTGAIAKAVGRAGGLIPLNDSGLYPGGAANAYGTAGNWQISTTGYSGISGGHPASLVTLSNGQLANNYLYRNAVPGQPQVNTMNTDIHMGGNSLDGASSVTAVGVYASEVQASGTIHSGERLTGDEYLQINGTATIGAPCSSAGGMQQAASSDGSGTPLYCQSGFWSTDKPSLVRISFTSSTTWTVPAGVKSAFVSMAGGGVGGVSGLDYGVDQPTVMISGSSGGYVVSYPVTLTPGQSINILVGAGGPAGAYPYGGPAGYSSFGGQLTCTGGDVAGGEAYGAPGYCVNQSGQTVGLGSVGQYLMNIGGYVSGGQTPLGYGSGGGDYRCNGCASPNPTVGYNGEPGIVNVDVLY